MLRNTFLVAVAALVLAGCENPLGGIFGDPNWIKVTSPNGGELWVEGEDHNITWKAPGVVDDVELHYSIDSGQNWTAIEEPVGVPVVVPGTDETFAWTIPAGVVETTCRVRVQEAGVGGTGLGDQSNANFEIRAPFIQVTSPNGGENWAVGDDRTITWIARGVAPGDVDIHYSTNSGGNYPPANLIATVPIGDGSCPWTVPDDAFITCRVRVQEAGGGISDESDADFTIAKITVTAPVGGETWDVSTSQNIIWTVDNVPGDVEIHYSIDGGTNYPSGNLIATVPGTDLTFPWTIPDDVSTTCRVRVREVAGAGASDESGADFTIAGITVTAPNSGSEVWDVGSSENITWTSTGVTNVRIELSRDGNWVNGDGSDVDEIVASTPAAAGSYPWPSVTGPDSTNCLVRVSDEADGSPSDESDAVFEITTP